LHSAFRASSWIRTGSSFVIKQIESALRYFKIRDRAVQAREKLVSKLPVTGELLRSLLLERAV
jgi:hypothetical protein